MSTYLLDTNICIYLIKNNQPALRARLDEYEPQHIAISSITAAELHYGVYKSQRVAQNERALAQFLMPIRIEEFDHTASQIYGRVRATLQMAGTPIGSLDMLIAAHALALGATVVTNNTREFSRVPNLHVENWLD